MRRALLTLLLAWGAHFPAVADPTVFFYNPGSCAPTNFVCLELAAQSAAVTWRSTHESEAAAAGANDGPGKYATRSALIASCFAGMAPGESAYYHYDSATSECTAMIYVWRPGSTCLGQLDVSRSLGVEVTLNPAATIPTVCYQGCAFDLASASNYTMGSQVWRLGEWVGTGAACEGQPSAVNDPTDTPDDPGGDPCDDENENGICDIYESDTTPPELTSLESAVGPLLNFSLPFLDTSPVERVCTLEIDTPVHGPIRTWFGEKITADFCPYLGKIDIIGGFLLSVFGAITIFGMFNRTPGT